GSGDCSSGAARGTAYSGFRRRSAKPLERFSQLYSEPIAAVSDVVPTLGRREERERGSGERGDVVEGARSRGTQERFQFRERHLDRIEVGAVGRQKSDLRAGGFDGRAHLWLFVDGEIVEHHDI